MQRELISSNQVERTVEEISFIYGEIGKSQYWIENFTEVDDKKKEDYNDLEQTIFACIF